MQDSEITIQVGFGDQMRELRVRTADGDIPPYPPGVARDQVGKSKNRVDALAKVTGRAKYTYDRVLPGMLHGKILRSPYANARVKSVDLAPALAMPGVKVAIAYSDVFSDTSVRFAGEGVAALAAETEQQALNALKAIRVEYEELPFSVTLDSAMADGAPAVVPDEGNVRQTAPRRPDPDLEERVTQILNDAPQVIEGTFTTEVQTHAPLETHGVVCTWEDQQLTCYCSTQATFGVKFQMTSSRGAVNAESAEVLAEYVGGGFGGKFSAEREGMAGALLAKAAGRPVKLMLDRREEQLDAGNRPDSRQELKMALADDGKILGMRIRNWGTAGSSPFGAGAHNNAIYKVGPVDKKEYGVRTNCGSARALRAPGHPQGVFALEGMMDMAAEKVGIDPFDFRKKNDDHPVRLAEYDIARSKSGWDQKRNKKPGVGNGIVKRGMGCASTLWYAAGGGGARVLVRIHKNGSVEVRNGCQDIGTGTRTIMGQVAAEELGLDVTQVQTFIGDTRDPQGPGSGGSTTGPTLTPATRLAAYNAKQKLLDIVAAERDWPREQLDLGVAGVTREGKPAGLSFKQACALMDDDQIEVLEARPTVERRRPNYEGFADTNAGVQVAEVEVDTETGVVQVKRVTAVADSGIIINPKLAESQVRGGIIQGVSFALFERRIMDRQKGHMLNADMESYKILGSVDCPEMDVTLLDVYNGKNNTHCMGLGEPPVVATAAAVANAVYNAIGVRITSLPITPKKVLEALAQKEARG